MMNEPWANESPMDKRESNLLKQVHRGLKVVGPDNKDIGSVDFVYFGDASDTAQDRGMGPATARDLDRQPGGLMQDVARAFDPDELPDEVRERLIHGGFVRVDTGLLGSDRYVIPEQIKNVENDKVYITASKDELIKR